MTKDEALKQALDALLKAARAKREYRDVPDDAPTLAGFGITFDIFTGRARNWYQSAGDVKRWADNDQPVEDVQ